MLNSREQVKETGQDSIDEQAVKYSLKRLVSGGDCYPIVPCIGPRAYSPSHVVWIGEWLDASQWSGGRGPRIQAASQMRHWKYFQPVKVSLSLLEREHSPFC